MEFNIWLLLAGIGILIFGMNVFEHAIKFLGGNKLKTILQKYTNNGWTSIFTGFWTTSILQSSSLLSLLVLAFAGAGVLALKNAIGLIFGANIGSPMLPLLAAVIGFGSFKISMFALPMIAIGGLALIFNLSEKKQQRAKLLVGFGLLFLGLDFMKESVEAIQASFDIAQYASLALWKFGILGVIVTLVIQSSGALGIMALAALDAGIISFPASIAIAMGSNIGTTFTAIIGSLGGSRIKRQIATSHVLFNVISGIIGIVFFWQYIRFTNDVLGFKDNPIMGNAVLNVIFNASTAILFGFFLIPFTKLVQWLVPIKSNNTTLRIEELGNDAKDKRFAQATLSAITEDTKTFIDKAVVYNSYIFGLNSTHIQEGSDNIKSNNKTLVPWDKEKHRKLYDESKHIGNVLLEHVLPVQHLLSDKESSEIATNIDKSLTSILRSMKSTKNIYHDIQDLRSSSDPAMKKLYATLFEHVQSIYTHISSITDRQYTTENFEQLTLAVAGLESFHQAFIKELTVISSGKKDPDIELSTLINIDHYVLQAASLLVKGIQYVYLTTHEEKTFQQITS